MIPYRAAILLAVAASVPAAAAQGGAEGALRLPPEVLERVVLPGPAGSITTPTAFGVGFGQGYVGVGVQAETRYTDDPDAAAVVGIGLGDQRVLGLEVALTSYSTLSERGGMVGEVGSVSFRLHRLLAEDLAVAAGWENPIHWGDSDAGESRYLVVSRIWRNHPDPDEPLSAVVMSMGVGDGRFRVEEQVLEGRERVNFFMSVGMKVREHASAIVDWTGQDLNLALSMMPLGRRIPVVVTPGVADLGGYAGDGARAILAVGYNFSYRNPFQ
jgi:hypothetical protein